MRRLDLLLLPPPPSILSSANTKAVYGTSIDFTLNHIDRPDCSRLDIAIAVPDWWARTQLISRKALFERAQKVLAQTYSLICASAAKQHIELDFPAGLDVRAFFLLATPQAEEGARSGLGDEKVHIGPFVDLTVVTQSDRIYDTLYTTEDDDGDRRLRSFLELYKVKHQNSPAHQAVPVSQSSNPDASNPSEETPSSDNAHVSVAVGGTFDHLHIGHKLLLTATALLAQPRGSPTNPSQPVLLTIGISGAQLLTKKEFAEELESWTQRQQKVADFLESVLIFPPTSPPSQSQGQSQGQVSRHVESISNPNSNSQRVRATINSSITIDYVELSDPFGPTVTDEAITALVVSQETRSGGRAINEEREQKGWANLEVFEVDVLEIDPDPGEDGDGEGEEDEDEDQRDSGPAAAASSFESKISSTEIRRRIHSERQRRL